MAPFPGHNHSATITAPVPIMVPMAKPVPEPVAVPETKANTLRAVHVPKSSSKPATKSVSVSEQPSKTPAALERRAVHVPKCKSAPETTSKSALKFTHFSHTP
eukprot:322752_1